MAARPRCARIGREGSLPVLLALDVGNTNLTVGVFEGVRLAADWRIRTDRDRTTDEHGILLTNLLQHGGLTRAQVTGLAISSVVPTMNDNLLRLADRYFDADPFLVGPGTDFGIEIHYQPPTDVGTDRLLNAVAAIEQYGGPAIIVDFGTGTTFDAISERGDYMGGAIAPGIGIATDALFQRAARLYRVELAFPLRAVGTNTVEALQSGIMFGYAGLVDSLVGRFREEIGQNAKVIATGGLADTMKGESKTIEIIDHHLTLNGLRILWERNGRFNHEDARSQNR